MIANPWRSQRVTTAPADWPGGWPPPGTVGCQDEPDGGGCLDLAPCGCGDPARAAARRVPREAAFLTEAPDLPDDTDRDDGDHAPHAPLGRAWWGTP